MNDLAEGKESHLVNELKELAQEGYNFLQIFVNN
jgi:hypothetical protein